MLVVGIGASAGGISALREFFAHSDPAVEAAYIVILHLSPDHESKLAQVLQGATPMPVQQVTGAVTLEARHVYVISPSRGLTASGGRLLVSDMTRLEQRRSPVDIFFRTLADAHHARAVAVILSGTGPDGSNGLKRIKEHDGLAIAQDPAEAEHGDMPRNAIDTSLVDYILPVAEMPARIAAYQRQLAGPAAGPSATAAGDQDSMSDVLAALRARTGHDFSNYKPATLHRRIARRMGILGTSSIGEYAAALS